MPLDWVTMQRPTRPSTSTVNGPRPCRPRPLPRRPTGNRGRGVGREFGGAGRNARCRCRSRPPSPLPPRPLPVPTADAAAAVAGAPHVRRAGRGRRALARDRRGDDRRRHRQRDDRRGRDDLGCLSAQVGRRRGAFGPPAVGRWAAGRRNGVAAAAAGRCRSASAARRAPPAGSARSRRSSRRESALRSPPRRQRRRPGDSHSAERPGSPTLRPLAAENTDVQADNRGESRGPPQGVRLTRRSSARRSTS